MPDYLSCGSCPVDFELADIVSFIEHKRQRCIDGSVDSEQLECIKCSKRFHTPWPLLFHIQVDHQILIVRNLNQLSLPLSFKTSVTPIVQQDNLMAMEMDTELSEKSTNQRDVFTQTQQSQKSVSCCLPRNLSSCCQKIEPQCYVEPCLCPSGSDVICTSDDCFINLDNQPIPTSDSKTSGCCACPQSSLKKESREVQTEFEYNDDVDINFLLSGTSESAHDYMNSSNNNFNQEVSTFQDQQYNTDFPIPMEKNWDFLNPNTDRITEHSNANYLPNYDNQDYQLLMPNIHLSANSNQNYAAANPNLLVDTRRPSLSSSPNQVLATTDNQAFTTLLNNCSITKSINGHVTLFQESNNSFHYKGLSNQTAQKMGNNVIVQNNSPNHKDSSAMLPRVESGSISFIQSGSDLSTENYENEKVETEQKEFRFLCPNCGKRFRQKVHLRKHVMSQHARQKPHKCTQCSYTTVEKSHLTVHIRTHTGERPYTCRRCSYSSAQNCTLKSHYLRRHPGDQIDCSLCGSYFITEQERNNHQRSCRIVNGISSVATSHGQHNESADNIDSLKTA